MTIPWLFCDRSQTKFADAKAYQPSRTFWNVITRIARITKQSNRNTIVSITGLKFAGSSAERLRSRVFRKCKNCGAASLALKVLVTLAIFDIDVVPFCLPGDGCASAPKEDIFSSLRRLA
jgi:hypothetical protein